MYGHKGLTCLMVSINWLNLIQVQPFGSFLCWGDRIVATLLGPVEQLWSTDNQEDGWKGGKGANMGNKSTQIGKTQFWVSFLPVRTNLKSGKLVIHQQQEEKQVAAKAASQTLLAKRLLPLAPASRSPHNIFSEIKLLDSPPFVATKMFHNSKKWFPFSL